MDGAGYDPVTGNHYGGGAGGGQGYGGSSVQTPQKKGKKRVLANG